MRCVDMYQINRVQQIFYRVDKSIADLTMNVYGKLHFESVVDMEVSCKHF